MDRVYRQIPVCDQGRPAVDSTCWCSTHTPSSSPASLSPAYAVWLSYVSQGRGVVLPRWKTSQKFFNKVKFVCRWQVCHLHTVWLSRVSRKGWFSYLVEELLKSFSTRWKCMQVKSLSPAYRVVLLYLKEECFFFYLIEKLLKGPHLLGIDFKQAG